LLNGILRYGFRIAKKLRRPPGAFLVFEGAAGVGKSTLLVQITSWCAEWNAGRTPYRFHWKPGCRMAANAGPIVPAGPEDRSPRSPLLSVVILFYHVLGFWWGWLTRVYPALVSSRVVIGDRYAYDMFLDPRRSRLNLSPRICRRAIALCPRPDLAVGLVVDPQTIHLRKEDLDPRKIASYQDRWLSLSNGSRRLITVNAGGDPDAVLLSVKQEVLKALVI
jgi:thymidylate kinase